LVAAILFGLLLYFFWPLLGEIKAAANLFLTANWIWFLIAIVLQVISYGFLTWLNALALQPFSGRIGFIRLAGVLTSMAFISVAIPSAGLSGVALRVHLLKKSGYHPEESLFSLMVETTLELIALVSVCLFGVVYLIQIGGISTIDSIWLVLISIFIIVTIVIIWLMVRQKDKSQARLISLVQLWNRNFSKIKKLDPDLYLDRMKLFQTNLGHYQLGMTYKLFVAAYSKVFLDVLTLGACFYMFHYPINLETLLIGYGLILAISGLTALPGGLVMIDAYVPVIFSMLGVRGPVAIAAGLTYRLIAFWLVRFVGFISWLKLEYRT
jgi:uncharacterized protein (TIRG00374 family)